MILQSRLSKTAYPRADPKEHLVGDCIGLDPVLAGRQAYYAKVKGIILKITRGRCTTAEQAYLYALYLQYLKTGRGAIRSAAKPGDSWHEPGLAADSSTEPFRSATNEGLEPFDLCKPIKSEGWHAQPLETKGKSSKLIPAFTPVDLAPQVKAKYGFSDMMMAFIALYEYTADFCAGLLAGKKDFEDQTIDYFETYGYWDELQAKTGIH